MYSVDPVLVDMVENCMFQLNKFHVRIHVIFASASEVILYAYNNRVHHQLVDAMKSLFQVSVVHDTNVQYQWD